MTNVGPLIHFIVACKFLLALMFLDGRFKLWNWFKTYTVHTHRHNRLTAFGPDYPGRPVPEETFTHSHPSWSSDILYQLPPFTTIHSILFVQCTSLTVLFVDSTSLDELFVHDKLMNCSVLLFLHILQCFSSHRNAFLRYAEYAS